MIVITCVDDNKGMLFNGRRQSKDKKVTEKILEIVGDHPMYINEFSQSLFPEKSFLCENPLETCGMDDFCFIENLSLTPYKEKINKLYLFHWNRVYPHDFSFDLDLSNNFSLKKTEEFVGNSHEKITLEEWINEK